MNQKLNRAVEGDHVWVILNHVKAENWEGYKDFVFNIFIPAAEKISPNEMANTRFLSADEPNEDGSYTTVWLMDPVVQDGNYSILDILKQQYGGKKGEEYFKMWAAEHISYSVKQSPW